MVVFSWVLAITCVIQAGLAIAFMSSYDDLGGVYILIIHPFFLVAAIFGLIGAIRKHKILVLAHLVGSLGVGGVFILFFLMDYLSRVDKSWTYMALSLPFSIFMLATSIVSCLLYCTIPRKHGDEKCSDGCSCCFEDLPENENLIKRDSKLEEITIKSEPCVICMDQKKNCLLYPCGHICACFTCGNMLKKDSKPCPMCRQVISDVVKTYVA